MERTKRIFISGPMTGVQHFNKEVFEKAEEYLKGIGWQVINPVAFDKIILGEDYYTKALDNSEFNPEDLKMTIKMELQAMETCNAIYMLRGWENSIGAREELRTAIELGLNIILQEHEL